MIPVLIVDAYETVRTGREHLLANAGDVEVAGSAASGAEAVELVALPDIDVVLMDVAERDLDGLATVRELRRRRRDTKILVLTASGDEDQIAAAPRRRSDRRPPVGTTSVTSCSTACEPPLEARRPDNRFRPTPA